MLDEREVEIMQRLFSEHPDDNIKKITVTLELEQSGDNPTGTHRKIKHAFEGADLEPTRKASLEAIRTEIVTKAKAGALAQTLNDIEESRGKPAADFFKKYQLADENDQLEKFFTKAYGTEFVSELSAAAAADEAAEAASSLKSS